MPRMHAVFRRATARTRGLRTLLLVAGTAVPGLALAHPEAGTAMAFASGFAHPFGGLDHLLAMFAVGMFAAGLGGRALWAVPLAFLAFILAGGGLAMLGVQVPFVEAGIALSIVALGLAVALGRPWPVAAAMALVAVFAVFHGHAHGSEMPANASGLGYALGFTSASALLHLAGILAGVMVGSLGRERAPALMRVTGMVFAVIGVGVLAGVA